MLNSIPDNKSTPFLASPLSKKQHPIQQYFGASPNDTVEKTSAKLPEWANIPAPKITEAEVAATTDKILNSVPLIRQKKMAEAIEKAQEEKGDEKLTEKEIATIKKQFKKDSGLFKNMLKIKWQNWQLKWYKGIVAPRHLPKRAKARRRNYFWSTYWWKYCMGKKSRREARLQMVIRSGPAMIKSVQAEVEETRNKLPEIRKKLKRAEKGGLLHEFINDSMPFGIKQMFNWFLLPSFRKQLENKIQFVETYLPILNQTEIAPYSFFKKNISDLKSAYNKEHSKDPIISIDEKGFRAGSIGQIFMGKTKSGKKLVFKVRREDAYPEFINNSKAYLYYSNMLSKGNSDEDKNFSVRETEAHADFLNREADFSLEAKNLRLLATEFKRLSITSIVLPKPLVASSTGIIMPYVGQSDLSDLQLKDEAAAQKVLGEVGGDLGLAWILSDNKPLDVHGGNIRQKADHENHHFFIDVGRQANLKKETHHKLLKLMIAFYSLPSYNLNVDTLIENKRFMSALNSLFLNPKSNSYADALKSYKAIKPQIDKLSKKLLTLTEDGQTEERRLVRQEIKTKEAEKTKLKEKINELINRLFGPVVKSESTESRSERQNNQLKKSIQAGSFSPMSLWANYILLNSSSTNEKTFEPMYEYDMSLKEIENIHRKFTSTLSAHFSAPLETEPLAELFKVLKDAEPDELVELAKNIDLSTTGFDFESFVSSFLTGEKKEETSSAILTEVSFAIQDYSSSKKRLEELRKKQTSKKDCPFKKEAQAYFIERFEPATERLTKAQKKLAGNKTVQDRILLQSRRNHRMNTFVDNLMTHLTKSDARLYKNLTKDEIQNLEKNLLAGLNNDFKMAV